jgi:uncharacterized membrane protein
MDASLRIDIFPNCSLTPHGALVFFGAVCVGSFGIAGLMAIQGYWPVLPFAGLEMAVLGWALRASLARRHHREIITVDESEVRITSRYRASESQVVFPRHWAQVKLRRPVSRLHPSRLFIESHGRGYEVGSFLTEEERRGLARRLARLIGRINESPSLI